MSELVLGIESSSDRGSVALCRDGQLIAEATSVEPNRHAESLLPLMQQLLLRAGVTKQDLGAVVVGTGPGSFTGLRVGLSLATGIGLGLAIPVFGVSSLVTLASALLRHLRQTGHSGDETRLALGAVLDARRGESFFAAYNRDLEPLVEPCLIPNADVQRFVEQQLASHRLLVAGEAAERVLSSAYLAPPEVARTEALAFPSAYEAAVLAHSRHATVDPLPCYLRDADAKLPQLPPNPLANVD